MKRVLTALVLGMALLVPGACSHKNKSGETESPTVDVACPKVDSVILHKSYPGYLSADRTVDIVGRVNGTLMSKNYESGSKVREGQVLFTIEDTQYRDAVARAEAELANATSARDYARDHYAALQQAYASDAVSRMELEQGRNALESSEAAIRTAQANLSTARTNLGYCTVRAPFTGHISDNLQSAGSYISGAGAPVTLATLYKDDILTADFSIDDASLLPLMRRLMEAEGTDYNRIPVKFEDPALNGRYFGKLGYIAPDVSTSTGTVELKADVENDGDELRSGMYVTIDLPDGIDPHAVIVLDAAIARDQRGSYMYTVNDSNKVVYTAVVPGDLIDDTLRIISSGLGADDRYVTRALLKVRPGMTVTPRLTE